MLECSTTLELGASPQTSIVFPFITNIILEITGYTRLDKSLEIAEKYYLLLELFRINDIEKAKIFLRLAMKVNYPHFKKWELLGQCF